MYFKLAKNSRLQMTSSTADVVYATVIYEQGINPSKGYIEIDNTVFAIAYNGELSINSIILKNESESNVTSICIYADNDLLVSCFSLASGNTVVIDESGLTFQNENSINTIINNTIDNSGVGSGCCANENLVEIIQRNIASQFDHAHGSVQVGVKLFLGTRNWNPGVTVPRLVYYPDYNDFTTFQYITTSASGTLNRNGLESLDYDVSVNKIICGIADTKNLLIASANDITINTTTALTMTYPFGFSSPIMSDGAGYVYTTSHSSGTCKILKINISSFVVTELTWSGVDEAHSGHINLTDGFAYFISNSPTNTLAKVNLSTFTIASTVTLTMPGATTDDCLFLPKDLTGTGMYGFVNLQNIIIIPCEGRALGKVNNGTALIDVDNMVVYYIDTMPSVSIMFDIDNFQIVLGCIDGFIEVINMASLIDNTGAIINNSVIYDTDIYTMRGFEPNELYPTTAVGEYICTSFDTKDGGGNLMRIKLKKVNQPILTKAVATRKYSTDPNPPSGGGSSWTTVVATDANITAANDTSYYIAAGTFTANRTINVSAITTKFRLVIEQDFSIIGLSFTGGTVYDSGGSNAITNALGQWTTVYEKVGSKIIRIQ